MNHSQEADDYAGPWPVNTTETNTCAPSCPALADRRTRFIVCLSSPSVILGAAPTQAGRGAHSSTESVSLIKQRGTNGDQLNVATLIDLSPLDIF